MRGSRRQAGWPARGGHRCRVGSSDGNCARRMPATRRRARKTNSARRDRAVAAGVKLSQPDMVNADPSESGRWKIIRLETRGKSPAKAGMPETERPATTERLAWQGKVDGEESAFAASKLSLVRLLLGLPERDSEPCVPALGTVLRRELTIAPQVHALTAMLPVTNDQPNCPPAPATREICAPRSLGRRLGLGR
jgi:hypothetical protein